MPRNKKSPAFSLPIRLSRSIQVSPTTRLNVSRKGISMTLDLGSGMKINIGPKGNTVYGGPPGMRFRRKLT